MAVWIIAKLTIIEAVRRRIVLVGVLLGVVLLDFTRPGLVISRGKLKCTAHRTWSTAQNFNNFLIMSGFYAVNFLALMLVGLMSANALAGEINSGAVQTTAVKPIRRIEIVLGKWLGLGIPGFGVFIVDDGWNVFECLASNPVFTSQYSLKYGANFSGCFVG